MRDYETALTLFKSARYKDALAAFLNFITPTAIAGCCRTLITGSLGVLSAA